MRIAIASVKGGTGKTTVAANLACALADSGQPVQYLDCDVEEPNGHIVLKPAIATSEPVGIPVPAVDEDRCTGCRKCADGGDRRVRDFCAAERIPVLLEIPDDRRVAEAYSRGILAIDALPGWPAWMLGLWQRICGKEFAFPT